MIGSCAAKTSYTDDDLAWGVSLLSEAERTVRAGQIRDAAAAVGMTQGWLLAGIADAETGMAQCLSEYELVACAGPFSAECNGPVLAGGGDGPCSLRQGGLGMFQFDAGTFEQTLARESAYEILTVAGNTEAAVNFVTNMVIRSVYIPNVSTATEAIEWMNGVTTTNSRMEPWAKTVTHYYNGCTPTGCSVYNSRLARYRGHAIDIYNKYGADFWNQQIDWGGQWVSQSFPLASQDFILAPGEERAGSVVLRNTGSETWRPNEVFLGTTEPRDAASPIAASDWVSPGRAATVTANVEPGEDGVFNFSVRGPSSRGEYAQFFNLVREGVAWFSDQGGPMDNQLQVKVTVTMDGAVDTCEGVPAEWRCSGDSRQRCNAGMVETELCAGSCVAGANEATCSSSGPVDEDNDGHNTSVDCDDTNDSIFPGAEDMCGDGVDSDCDNVDPSCDGTQDGSVTTRDGGTADLGPDSGDMTLEGGCGCHVTQSSNKGGLWAGLLLMGVCVLRRKRRNTER